MRMLQGIGGLISRFARDERGSVIIEGVIMVPILVWVFVSTFSFFDGFRANSISARTGYTILDALSRETGYVTPSYVNGLFNLQRFLEPGLTELGLQITVFNWTGSGTSGNYNVIWSQARGTMTALTTAQLRGLRSRLPNMYSGEIVILVQTTGHYSAKINSDFTGLLDHDFSEFMVMRPRFATQLCWNSKENGDYRTAIC